MAQPDDWGSIRLFNKEVKPNILIALSMKDHEM